MSLPNFVLRHIRLGSVAQESLYLQAALGMRVAIATGNEYQHWVDFFIASYGIDPLPRQPNMSNARYVRAVERRNHALRYQLELRIDLLALGAYPFPPPPILAPNGGGPVVPVAPAMPGMFNSGTATPTVPPPPYFPPPPSNNASFPPHPNTSPATMTFVANEPSTSSIAESSSGARGRRGQGSVQQAGNQGEGIEVCLMESNRDFFFALREALSSLLEGENAVLCHCSRHHGA